MTDLPGVLARWQRAVTAFHASFESLGQLIASHKRFWSTGTGYSGGAAQSYSIGELENIQKEMILELARLLTEIHGEDAMNDHFDLNYLNRLHAHTLRFQNKVQQIQRIFN